MIKRYLRIWWLFSIASFQTQLNVRWGLALFLIAKVLRFATFTFFLVVLLKTTKVLAGYSLDQTILFFLSFNLLDILSQLFFREVYRFRQAVLFGNFDFYLIKPINPLFRSLFAGPDLLDFITLIPLIFAIIIFINRLHFLNIVSLSIYFFMLVIGFLTALSFHILVLCLGILTTEIDNAIMLYRDIVAMGRMPIDIYMEPIRGILTFIIPVGIMMTFPTKAVLGLLSPIFVIYAILLSIGLFYLSLKIWDLSLRQYSSASS